MAIIDKPLMDPAQIAATTTTYYTAPAGVRTRITKLVLCNTSLSTSYTVMIYIVPSGGTAGNSNAIINTRAILPGETYDSFEIEGLTLEPGATVQAICSSANAITMHMSGLEMTT